MASRNSDWLNRVLLQSFIRYYDYSSKGHREKVILYENRKLFTFAAPLKKILFLLVSSLPTWQRCSYDALIQKKVSCRLLADIFNNFIWLLSYCSISSDINWNLYISWYKIRKHLCCLVVLKIIFLFHQFINLYQGTRGSITFLSNQMVWSVPVQDFPPWSVMRKIMECFLNT